MSDIQEPWASALCDAGYTDPRSAERASWSALGRAIGVHTSTLSAMAQGTRDTSQEILDKVAAALRIDPRRVAEWVGVARSERAPYVPPSDAHLLDRDERDAVDRLITLLAKSKKRGQSDAGTAEAEKNLDPAPMGRDNVTKLTPKHQRMLEEAQQIDRAAYDGKGQGEE